MCALVLGCVQTGAFVSVPNQMPLQSPYSPLAHCWLLLLGQACNPVVSSIRWQSSHSNLCLPLAALARQSSCNLPAEAGIQSSELLGCHSRVFCCCFNRARAPTAGRLDLCRCMIHNQRRKQKCQEKGLQALLAPHCDGKPRLPIAFVLMHADAALQLDSNVKRRLSGIGRVGRPQELAASRNYWFLSYINSASTRFVHQGLTNTVSFICFHIQLIPA